MKQEFTLRLSPSQAADETLIRKQVATLASCSPQALTAIKVTKKSIDARRGQIIVQLKVFAVWDEVFDGRSQIEPFHASNVSSAPTVLVVGAGPAGLFAALTLIEQGIKPVIIERGKDVSRRKGDVANLNKTGTLNPESNYCFGEGGAGTFSDGKIYTRSNKKGNIQRVLELFVLHGANPDILIEAHPHLGTDKLPTIITAIKKTILDCGGEFHFDTRMSSLRISHQSIQGITTGGGEILSSAAVILATGHSARDVYEQLMVQQIPLQPKPFAMGVRVEHPRELIDTIQYHGRRDPLLPTASYSLKAQADGRGVYSFCMCPGGIMVPAATADGEIVVNGMSNSQRNSPYSNSGIAVEIALADVANLEKDFGPLAALEYQKRLESLAFQNSPGHQKAPAQRLTDFIHGTTSPSLPASSYLPGLSPSSLHEWLPNGLSKRLQEGFLQFGKSMKGFITREAIIVGVESRTSSPVRIPRDDETLEHLTVGGLYPCGEGAGYAGGITSSAMDGILCALKAAQKIKGHGPF